MPRPDEDLGRLAADAVRVRHWMTQRVHHAPADAPSHLVATWMDALDLSLAPLEGDPVQRYVRRADLVHPDTPVASASQPIAPPHLVGADLSLDEALPHLARHGWFFVLAGRRVVGVVTRSDLARPAVTQHVLTHLLTLEQGLDQLLRSYGGFREPPTGRRSFFQTVDDTLRTPALRDDLGLDPASAGATLHDLRRLRNHLAHGRSVLDHEPDLPDAIHTALETTRLCRKVWALLDDRPQIWAAFLDAQLTHPATGAAWPPPLSGVQHAITACNPAEERFPDAINQRRNQALRGWLEAAGGQLVDSLTTAPDGSWPEPGFLVRGLPLDAILPIAARFDQRAIYEITPSERRVIDMNGQVRAHRPHAP